MLLLKGPASPKSSLHEKTHSQTAEHKYSCRHSGYAGRKESHRRQEVKSLPNDVTSFIPPSLDLESDSILISFKQAGSLD